MLMVLWVERSVVQDGTQEVRRRGARAVGARLQTDDDSDLFRTREGVLKDERE